MLRIRSRYVALPLSYLVVLGCGSQDPNPTGSAGETPSGSGGEGASASAPAGGQAGASTPGGTGGQPTAGAAGAMTAGAGGSKHSGGSGGAAAGSGGALTGTGGASAGAGGVGGAGDTTAGTGGEGGSPTCDLTFYRDQDGDGFGRLGDVITDCAAPAGYVDQSGDCNDSDPNNWTSCATCRDGDADGHFTQCDTYSTIKGDDCDDSRPWINKDMVDAPPLRPGDTEDWDCDGIDVAVDEAVGVFVSPHGYDTNPGTRSQPVRTLGRGVEIAESSALYAVFVAEGNYKEQVTTSVSVFGGYDADTWARDPLVHLTRIAAPSDNALSVASSAKVALQGFELQGANATTTASAPLRADQATFVLHSVRISGGDNMSPMGEVAAISTNESTAFIVKSDVYSGTAGLGTYGVRASKGWAYLEASSVSMSQAAPAARSAGLALAGARGTVWRSSVMGGRARNSFGILAETPSGLFVLESAIQSGTSLSAWPLFDARPTCVALGLEGGAATVQSSVLISGQTTNGCFTSRALDSAGTVTLVNALLDAGDAETGAAMLQRSGQSVIVGSTLVANSGPEGHAWDLRPGSLGIAVNSIFSFYAESGIEAAGTLQSFYNDIWSPGGGCLVRDGSSSCATTAQQVDAKYCVLPTCGNISLDPQFDANLQIGSGSPCVNAGIDPSPWFADPIVDLNGQLRPLGGTYDQGAFEVR